MRVLSIHASTLLRVLLDEAQSSRSLAMLMRRFFACGEVVAPGLRSCRTVTQWMSHRSRASSHISHVHRTGCRHTHDRQVLVAVSSCAIHLGSAIEIDGYRQSKDRSLGVASGVASAWRSIRCSSDSESSCDLSPASSVM